MRARDGPLVLLYFYEQDPQTSILTYLNKNKMATLIVDILPKLPTSKMRFPIRARSPRLSDCSLRSLERRHFLSFTAYLFRYLGWYSFLKVGVEKVDKGT